MVWYEWALGAFDSLEFVGPGDLDWREVGPWRGMQSELVDGFALLGELSES